MGGWLNRFDTKCHLYFQASKIGCTLKKGYDEYHQYCCLLTMEVSIIPFLIDMNHIIL